MVTITCLCDLNIVNVVKVAASFWDSVNSWVWHVNEHIPELVLYSETQKFYKGRVWGHEILAFVQVPPDVLVKHTL